MLWDWIYIVYDFIDNIKGLSNEQQNEICYHCPNPNYYINNIIVI